MHILFVGDFNYPGFFGDSYRIPVLASFLKKLGVKISFLLMTYPRKEKFYLKERKDEIDVHRLFPYIYHEKLNSKIVRFIKPLETIPNTLRMVKYLGQLIKSENFDLVVGFMPRLSGGVPASYSKYFNKPFLLDVSDFEYYTPFWRIFRGIDRNSIFKADLITVINKFVKNYIAELGISSKRIKNIPNGINFQVFNPNIDGSMIREKYPDRPIILHVGAFYNLNLVLKAIALIVKKNPDALFIFVGARNYNYYKNWISNTKYKNNFVFKESVPQKVVAQYIAASDICIHIFSQSKYLDVAQPLKILEYYACKKPVISRDLSGVRDILRGSYLNNYLIKNPAEFANRINELLVDESLRAQLGESGHKLIANRFDWENIAKKFMKICEQLVG